MKINHTLLHQLFKTEMKLLQWNACLVHYLSFNLRLPTYTKYICKKLQMSPLNAVRLQNLPSNNLAIARSILGFALFFYRWPLFSCLATSAISQCLKPQFQLQIHLPSKVFPSPTPGKLNENLLFLWARTELLRLVSVNYGGDFLHCSWKGMTLFFTGIEARVFAQRYITRTGYATAKSQFKRTKTIFQSFHAFSWWRFRRNLVQ